MYVCGVPLTPLHGGMDAVDDCEKAVKEAGNERILVCLYCLPLPLQAGHASQEVPVRSMVPNEW